MSVHSQILETVQTALRRGVFDRDELLRQIDQALDATPRKDLEEIVAVTRPQAEAWFNDKALLQLFRLYAYANTGVMPPDTKNVRD